MSKIRKEPGSYVPQTIDACHRRRMRQMRIISIWPGCKLNKVICQVPYVHCRIYGTVPV